MKKILRVNMSELSSKVESSPESYALLGGRAFIARFMLDEVRPTCEPLGRHNKLIFAPGLLGGSKVYCAGRISIGAKSPLTGGIKESNGGGDCGIKLGRLGYQAVVIEDLPLDSCKYLIRISAAGAEFFPAEEYWGLGVYETTRQLLKRFGPKVTVSCIGPAGEFKLHGAGIANTDKDGNPSRYSARGGLGAVMGSKGIKAVIVDDAGTEVIAPVKAEGFSGTLKHYVKLMTDSPVIHAYTKFGTSAMVQMTNAVGGLPTRNFGTGKFAGAENISGEKMYDVIMARKGKPSHACQTGCVIRCSNDYVDEQGVSIVAPLEYETLALMGSNLAIDDLDVIARLNYLCNDYGLDTIETGAALGVAMDGGLISFGDAKGAIDLVHEIGKGTVVGRVLGMGAQTTGRVLGVTNVPVVKGQAMAGYEPRGIKGLGVTYATSPMGADHTAGPTARVNVDHNSKEGQAELSKKVQYILPIYDYLGLCMFVGVALNPHLEVIATLVSEQLGIDFGREDLFRLSEATVQNEIEFNKRAGFTKIHDRLPEHFVEIPNPSTGTTFDVSDEELDSVHGNL